MTFHKDWDINEHATGRSKNNKPIVGVTLQNGLNDIEPDGSFVPCDMRISEVTQGVTHLKMNRGRMGELRFGDSSHPNSFLVKIKDKGLRGVSFKYTGADGESMTANNGKPLCHFSNGISIESTPYYKGVKMDIIVNDPLTAPLEYPFSVKTYGQEYIVIEENGGLTFIGDDLAQIYVKPPYAVDANGDIGSVTTHYTGMDGNLITFKKVVDETWLRQAMAPVRIDPDVETIDDVSGTFEDATIQALAPDKNHGGWNTLMAFDGAESSHINFLCRVDLSAYSDITVTSAKYIFDCTLVTGTPVSYGMIINPSKRQWNEGNKIITHASTGEVTARDARHDEVDGEWAVLGANGADTDYDSTISDTFATPTVLGIIEVPLSTASVQSKIETPATNYGDIFRSPQTLLGSGVRFASSEHTTETKPVLYFEYTEGGVVSIALSRGRLVNLGGNLGGLTKSTLNNLGGV